MHCVGGVLTHFHPAQRIVSVASVAHEGSKGIDFDDIGWTTRKRSETVTYAVAPLNPQPLTLDP